MKAIKEKTNTSFAGKKDRYIFIACMLAVPILFFCVFSLGVKLNSVLLSLKEYVVEDKKGSYEFLPFSSLGKNFGEAIGNLFNDQEVIWAFKNSVIFYLVGLLFTMPLSIFITYIIYKKIPGSKLFTIMAYLPQMLSTIIMTLMFKNLVEKVLPYLLGKPELSVFKDYTKLGVFIYYNSWVNLGANVILYLGAMTRIPEDLIEVGQLEGISLWKEFRLITLPLIFPTITVFIVAGVAGLFTNQNNLYNFYDAEAPKDISNLGYYMFVRVIGNHAQLRDYPYASAFGVLFTMVAAPITLLVKYLLEKFGPSAEF
nr:sugar ABC transporter permease [Clostridia bacterium]